MITVDEAVVALNDYANREFSGYPISVCPNLFSDIIELLTHLQSENELKARVIREIKSSQTGVGALRLALIRVKELEDGCGCKDKAREFLRYLSSLGIPEESTMIETFKQKFNLKE